MILTFSITNFRSIDSTQTLDFQASSSTKLSGNIIDVKANKEYRLLKSIGVYGANASGKSNIVRALFNFRRFILESTDLKKGDKIREYQPFLLNQDSAKSPTIFKIEFIADDNIKYIYEVKFNSSEVLFERLDSYQSTQPNNLFIREQRKPVILGLKFENRKVETSILENHLFLSRMTEKGLDKMGSIYMYFKNIIIRNQQFSGHIKESKQFVEKLFNSPKNEWFRNKLNELIRFSDTDIDSIEIKEKPKDTMPIPDGLSNELAEELYNQNRFEISSIHRARMNGKMENVKFNFNDESAGTNYLFVIGGLILSNIMRNSVLFIDELDNSLHPYICRMLLRFHNSNSKKAQLLFASHDTTLLDNSLFRKDQLWLTEKVDGNKTCLYTLDDFEELRYNSPFNTWYLKGKFGGVPNLKDNRFSFND